MHNRAFFILRVIILLLTILATVGVLFMNPSFWEVWGIFSLIGVVVQYFPFLFVVYGVPATIVSWPNKKTRITCIILVVVGLFICGYIVTRELYRIPKQKMEYSKLASSFSFTMYLPKYLPSGYRPQTARPRISYKENEKLDCFNSVFTKKLPEGTYDRTITIKEERYDPLDDNFGYVDKCWGAIRKEAVVSKRFELIPQTISNLDIFTSNFDNYDSSQIYYTIVGKTLITLLLHNPNNIVDNQAINNRDEIIRVLDSLAEIDTSDSNVFIDNGIDHATAFNWTFLGYDPTRYE